MFRHRRSILRESQTQSSISNNIRGFLRMAPLRRNTLSVIGWIHNVLAARYHTRAWKMQYAACTEVICLKLTLFAPSM
jgi:hypothetical protein